MHKRIIRAGKRTAGKSSQKVCLAIMAAAGLLLYTPQSVDAETVKNGNTGETTVQKEEVQEKEAQEGKKQGEKAQKEEIQGKKEKIQNGEAQETADQEGQAPDDSAEENPDIEQGIRYDNIAIAQVTNYVHVRQEPTTESEIIGKLYDKAAAIVLEETENGWYYVESGSVKGYIHADYVVVGDDELAKSVGTQYATVATTTLFVRMEPTTEAKILTMLPEGADYIVTEEYSAEWVKVSTEEGEGYISTDYISLSMEYEQAESKEEEEARLAAEREAEEARVREEEAQRQREAEAARVREEEAKRQRENEAAQKESAKAQSTGGKSSVAQSAQSSNTSDKQASAGNTSRGQAVVDYAGQFVGNPYVYGGTSLTNGADCSGFVMSVYAAFGVSLPHSSAALRNVGYEVSQSQIQPGDIVCYEGHVGIYAGNNTLLHASSSATGIKYTTPITYRPIVAIRRIF